MRSVRSDTLRDERELLPLRPDRQIQRQLRFEDRVGAALERDRVRHIAGRRIGPRDVADRQQRAPAVRADRCSPRCAARENASRAPSRVAGRAIDVGEVGQHAAPTSGWSGPTSRSRIDSARS